MINLNSKITFSKDKIWTEIIYGKLGIFIKIFLYVLELKFFDFINCAYGLFADLQLVFVLKNFFNSIGCSNLSQLNISLYNIDFRFLFLLNMSLVSVEEVDFVILACTNLRLEAPLLASRLRKNCINNIFLRVYSFGLAVSNYFLSIKNVGNSLKSLVLFLEGKARFMINFFSSDFYNFIFLNFSFLNFIKPVVFLGAGCIYRFDLVSIVSAFFGLSFRFFSESGFCFVNVISNNLGFLSGCEIGALLNKKKLNKGLIFEYVLNTDFFFFGSGVFVYQGSFIDNNYIFSKFDLVFPCSIFLEQDIVYLNLEGRYRYSRQVIEAKGVAQSDFDIIQALSILRFSLVKWNFSVLTNFFKVMKNFFFHICYECGFFATFQDFCDILNKNFLIQVVNNVNYLYLFRKRNVFIKVFNSIISSIIVNYYAFDVFAKNSKVLSIGAWKALKSNFIF